MHTPLAHASPPEPQLLPFGANTSAGHAELLPVHISAVSHCASLLGRHTCVLGANVHCAVQHSELSGSHTASPMNLHVLTSQQVEFEPRPGSHSSPASTMPFPHIWSVMRGLEVSDVGAFAEMRQDVFVFPPELPAMSEPGAG